MKPHIHKEPEKLQSECTLEEKEKKILKTWTFKNISLEN